MTHNIGHITVIGAGAMGSQIAMVSALAGFSTTVVDISQDSLDRARQQLWSRVDRDVEKGRRTAEDVEQAKDRLIVSTQQDEAVAHTDFVIEAAIEDRTNTRDSITELD